MSLSDFDFRDGTARQSAPLDLQSCRKRFLRQPGILAEYFEICLRFSFQFPDSFFLTLCLSMGYLLTLLYGCDIPELHLYRCNSGKRVKKMVVSLFGHADAPDREECAFSLKSFEETAIGSAMKRCGAYKKEGTLPGAFFLCVLIRRRWFLRLWRLLLSLPVFRARRRWIRGSSSASRL